MGGKDKNQRDGKSRRVKRERWILRSSNLKKKGDSDSRLLCNVKEFAIAKKEKNGDAEMEALRHGNSYWVEAQKLRSEKCRAVKSLKMEKKNCCRDLYPGHIDEVDTDVEEVGVIYLERLVEEESDGCGLPQLGRTCARVTLRSTLYDEQGIHYGEFGLDLDKIVQGMYQKVQGIYQKAHLNNYTNECNYTQFDLFRIVCTYI